MSKRLPAQPKTDDPDPSGCAAHVRAKDFLYVEDAQALIDDPERIAELAVEIREGRILVVRRAFDPDTVASIRQYLSNVGRHSLANYHPIEAGCPNSHRVNRWDERAYVRGCFHQFSFFPWNQDVFDLFGLARSGFRLKNALSGFPAERFLGREPEGGCTARLSFQFYPSGCGALNKHADPIIHELVTAPTLMMSKKGTDFQTGGAYVDGENGKRLYLDDVCDVGDLVYYNVQIPHGVETIDAGRSVPWVDFQGRWMMLLGTNKLASNPGIGNSREVE